MISKTDNRSMTVKELQEKLYKMLLPVHGKEESNAMIYRLFEHYLGFNRPLIVIEREKTISRQKSATIMKAAAKLAENVPLQYITGKAFFLDFSVRVNRYTLIPRPETEEMVLIAAHLLTNKPPKNILDIGTGSGCIAIAMKRQFPSSQTVAIDISKKALQLASANAQNNSADIEFIQADILKSANFPGFPQFDFIISNPPYVRESEKIGINSNVLDYEPHRALFVPDHDPLRFYRAIGLFAGRHLTGSGMLMVEINEKLGNETVALFQSQGFTHTELRKDFRGRDRFVTAYNTNTVNQ